MLDEIIRRYIASYNDRDIDAMLACVTDDVVFENISNAGQSMRLDGKAMMRQVAEKTRVRVISCGRIYDRVRSLSCISHAGRS